MSAFHRLGSTRREFLAGGLAGTLAFAFSPVVQRLLAAEEKKRAKACILVWLNGGPSHLDTLDPKRGVETGGPFKAIDTTVPQMKLSEHLPKVAAQAKRFSLVRSLTSVEADHDRAYYYLHTGNQPQATVEFPSLGAVVARQWTGQEGDLPTFVSLGSLNRGGGAGFLGLEFAPYVVDDLNNPIANVTPPEGIAEARQLRRLKELEALNDRFARRAAQTQPADHARFTAKALRLMSGKGRQAFDLSQEPSEAMALYGAAEEDAAFARSCVLARRLVERGVRFVEVVLDGWDTHGDNFNQVQALCGQLDSPLAGLIADLSDRGVLDETLVVCMGEFGRTPAINAQNGRDHWSDAFSALVAGGGIAGGRVVGASDERGEQVKERPVGVPELFATLLSCCGIDGTKQVRTAEGRPIRLVDKAAAVQELL
jgi:uncharacterized protein (DUF1501 family)